MTDKRKYVKRKKTHLGIRVKILIPVIFINIFIGVVLSSIIMTEFKSQCIETGAQGALSIVTLAKARINGTQ